MPQVDLQTSANWRKTSPSSTFGTRDLAFYGVFLAPDSQSGATPFPVEFLGGMFNHLYVGTNGYLTFGDGTSNYDFGTDATMDGAELPGILVSEWNNSYQYVYSKTTGDAYNNTRRFTVRYEGSWGVNTSDQGNLPAGGPPDMIWEMTFYEDLPGIVDLVVVNDANNAGGNGVSGVTDGFNWVDNGPSGNNVGWGKGSYRIDTTDGTTAVITQGTTVEQGNRDMQIEHQFNHDTNGSTGNHEEDDGYVEVNGCVWNGSDFSRAVRALQQSVELYYVGQPIMGMGIEFVVAIANDTATAEMAVQALENAWGPQGMTFMFAPMVVGPESIYVWYP